MKFKSIRSFVAVVLLFFLLSTLLLSFPASAAVSDVTIQVTLLTPIEYTSVGEKATEEEMADAILAFKTITQVTYDAFIMDNPLQSMWMNINGSKIEIQPDGSRLGNRFRWKATYFRNTIQTRPEYGNPAEMTRILRLVVDSFLPEGETTYEIVKSIHDYVCGQTKYDLNGDYVYSAYGALVDSRAVCEGYAEAFKLLCDKNGIPCILISGKGITSSGEENHMWNYVRMEDGKWYAVDATWDDGNSISNSYLLVGSETIVNPKNGKLFSENHIADGDISDTSLKAFLYPDLALQSYLENNPPHTEDTGDTSDSESDSESNSGSSSEDSNTAESGTAGFESTSDETESTDSTSSTADSTVTDTGEDFSTGNSAVTEEETDAPSSPSYGYLNEDPEYFYYNQLNEEQQNFYNILKTVSAPYPDNTGTTTTESSVQTEDTSLPNITTDTEKPTTTPPATTTEKPITAPSTTESDSTEPLPPDSSSETQTDPIDLTTVSDSGDSDTITDILTIELSEITGDDTTTPDDSGFTVSLSDIIRIIVIVLALLALFGLVSLIVIRFSNNEKK